MKVKAKKTVEIFFIFIYYLITTYFILWIKANYLVTIFLYAGLPSIYLTLKKPQIFKKTIEFSIILALPAIFIFDYIMHVSNVWFEPSVIGIRVLNSFPIDTFIWGMFYVYFIVAFYEYFFDIDRNKKIFSHNTRYLFYLIAILLFIFGLFYFFFPELLIIKYVYIYFIIGAFILPSTIILYNYPQLISKIFIQALYFFLLGTIVEVTAVHLNQWHFGGEYYIGLVTLFGITFPFEEVLWLIFAVPAVLCLYEYFVDDLK